MLTIGFGFTSSNNIIFTGVTCFTVSAFIERISKKTTRQVIVYSANAKSKTVL